MLAHVRRRALALVVLGLAAWPCAGRAAEPCDATTVPRARTAVLARASACYLAHRLPDAVALYRGWLERAPDDRAVRVTLARLLAESGDLAGAEAEYDHLLAGGGNDTDRRALHRARADVRAWRGELAPAIAEYRGLIAADPGDAGALVALASALILATVVLIAALATMVLGVLSYLAFRARGKRRSHPPVEPPRKVFFVRLGLPPAAGSGRAAAR